MTDATAAPPDGLPDTWQAYLAWLRDPGAKPARSTRPPNGRTYRHAQPRRPAPKDRDPACAAATAGLQRLPDLGAALIAQARAELTDTEPAWEELVVHAAQYINGHKG